MRDALTLFAFLGWVLALGFAVLWRVQLQAARRWQRRAFALAATRLALTFWGR